jgi:enoyl-CoA hydratase/carnithine racemase
MAYETIIYEKEDGVATITLNRPQRLNAMSLQLRQELEDALDQSENDQEINAIIITGAPRPDGRPCFCAGADLKEGNQGIQSPMEKKKEGVLDEIDGMWKGNNGEAHRVWDKIATLSKPTIAAIDGVCTAGGLELILCCDLRVASETAQISDLHVKNMHSIGGAAATARLARLVGLAKAKELIFTGDPVDGHEAWRIGLANQVFPAERLMEEAKNLGRKIASMRPEAIRMAKASINIAADMGNRQAVDFSYLCAVASLQGTREAAERWPKKTLGKD